MTPIVHDDWLTIHGGDNREVLRTLPDESVQCVVTSPPYWGLRDYGTASWDGGDPECDHKPQAASRATRPAGLMTGGKASVDAGTVQRDCHCGAIRQDRQLGLEQTPEEYVANMVDVFREVRRALRKDGTLWLNLGDTFLPGKQLGGIPWRVAFALQQPYYTGRIKDERDRAWLAALVDGEGTLTILTTTSPHRSGESHPPIVQVRMTSERVVAKAASLVGVMSPAQYPPSMKGTRAVYQWRLNGQRAADIARELYPYLIEKRQQALILWNHQQVRETYTAKRGSVMPDETRQKQQVCRDLIRRLNHGEQVDTPSWMVEPPTLNEPGWYLRSDVIWAKPNPMPESVTDRPTKSHEYLFLLSKSATYHYDADAVREPHKWQDPDELSTNAQARQQARLVERQAWRTQDEWKDAMHGGREKGRNTTDHKSERAYRMSEAGRNRRSVWTIATKPYPGAHFATFPEALVEPCILAGTSATGACATCGAPWERVVEKGPSHYAELGGNYHEMDNEVRFDGPTRSHIGQTRTANGTVPSLHAASSTTTGWRPTCPHPGDPVPCVVLDPFAGTGTVGVVAQRLSRRALLIDLNPDYLRQCLTRNQALPLGLEVA